CDDEKISILRQCGWKNGFYCSWMLCLIIGESQQEALAAAMCRHRYSKTVRFCFCNFADDLLNIISIGHIKNTNCSGRKPADCHLFTRLRRKPQSIVISSISVRIAQANDVNEAYIAYTILCHQQ